MRARKRKEEPYIPQPPTLTQASIFTNMSYEDAFIYYTKICKKDEDIQSQIFLRFKNGTEAPATVHSKSNIVLGANNKPYKVTDNSGVLIIELSSTFKIPLAFLKALAFIPCPDQTFTQDYRVQYRDENNKNLELKNLMWVKYD